MKELYSWHKDDDTRWTVEGPGFYMAVEDEQEAVNFAAALNTAYDRGVSAFGDRYVVAMLLDRSEAGGWHGRLWHKTVIADSKMAAVGTAVFTALEEPENKGFSVRSVSVISIAEKLEEDQQAEEEE